MPRHVLLAAAAMAFGCSPCHGWEELRLVDQAGLDDGEALTNVELAITTFIEWTGRETTCVDKVKVKELNKPGERAESGYYRPQLRNIVVDFKDDEWRMQDITLHELCHAVDHEEGFVSLDFEAALEPYTLELNEETYRTADERTVEAFADICQLGPTLHPLWREMDARCGDDYFDPAYRAVHETLFTAQDRSVELGSFDGSYESWELSGVEDNEGFEGWQWGVLVTGAEGVFMLDTRYDYDADGVFESYQPVLRRIDPTGATVVESLELEPFDEALTNARGNPTSARHALLGSTTEPLLVDRFDPGSAWRIHSDPLELEAVSLPPIVEGGGLEGFEHEGQLIGSIDEGGWPSPAVATMGDNGWTELDFEDEALEISYFQAIEANQDGALAVFWGAQGPELMSLDLEGEVEWTAPMGLEGASTHSFSVHRLPDGTVLASPWVPVGGNANKLFPLRYHPTTNSFSAPSADCHTMRYYLDGVVWDGDYWMVWRPGLEDGGLGALSLMRLQIGDLE